MKIYIFKSSDENGDNDTTDESYTLPFRKIVNKAKTLLNLPSYRSLDKRYLSLVSGNKYKESLSLYDNGEPAPIILIHSYSGNDKEQVNPQTLELLAETLNEFCGENVIVESSQLEDERRGIVVQQID